MTTTTEGILNMPIDMASEDPLTARQVIETQRARIAELEARPVVSDEMAQRGYKAFVAEQNNSDMPCEFHSFQVGLIATLQESDSE